MNLPTLAWMLFAEHGVGFVVPDGHSSLDFGQPSPLLLRRLPARGIGRLKPSIVHVAQVYAPKMGYPIDFSVSPQTHRDRFEDYKFWHQAVLAQLLYPMIEVVVCVAFAAHVGVFIVAPFRVL